MTGDAMETPLRCLTLTGETLEEDAALVNKYRKYIDIAELRVDYLCEDDCFYARRFPSMINIPCILTIRRTVDGGKYDSSEFSRTALFGRALAFVDSDVRKNFAYVDFEEDFNVPGLQDAALAFGMKIIRSFHDFENPVKDLRRRCEQMRRTQFEIPKIAFMPKTLSDVTDLFREAAGIDDFDHIFCAMGPMGIPSRILSYKLHSYLTYVSPAETAENLSGLSQIDPVTLNDVYHFKSLRESTRLCAVTGWPLHSSRSPLIHNEGYKKHGMDRLFIPLPSTSAEESLEFAECAGIGGMAVTVPYKEDVIPLLAGISRDTSEIGACNTVVAEEDGWHGYNTDAYGFRRALEEFLGVKKLRRRHVAIIGAGGAARAVAYAVRQMGGKACVFNRTLSRAKLLADQFGFEYSALDESCVPTLRRYADIIIQTTSVGMDSHETPEKSDNPLYFYQFRGTEYLFDIVYVPEITPVMAAAARAGCSVCNGLSMLKYQGWRQFKYFTGAEYEKSDAE